MPCAIQLFGDEPEPMARAAELAQQYSPAWLDINMGCPAPKIAGNRSGSALMLEPDRAESIIRAVKEASSIRSPSSSARAGMTATSTPWNLPKWPKPPGLMP